MVVRNISRRGIKMEVNTPQEVAVGDQLLIEFHLDDANKSFIKKKGTIRKIQGREIGVEFVSISLSDPHDRAIGFYLLG